MRADFVSPAGRPGSLPTQGQAYSYGARRGSPRGSRFFRDLTAPVAQLDRAPDYESGGQEFESLRARQSFQLLIGRMSRATALRVRNVSASTLEIEFRSAQF